MRKEKAIKEFKFKDLSFLEDRFFNNSNWRIVKFTDSNDLFHYRVFTSDDSDLIIDHRSDKIYLEMAQTWAKNSYCERKKVGCLIVNNRAVISDGYNGSPTGFPNRCEINDVTLPYVLHAEANAITKLARGTQSSDGSVLYVTLSPCYECSKLIIQSGIKRVVFNQIYRKTESISFLAEAGIEIIKINI
jgi:dCMP deaminase